MKDYYNICDINFDDPYLRAIVTSINNIFRTNQSEFANLCYYFYELKKFFKDKGIYYKAFGHIKKDNSNKYGYSDIVKILGYEECTVNKFIQCYEKFVVKEDVGVAVLEDCFKLFTSTKLFELLSLSKETIVICITNKIIRYDMTIKELRDVVKKIKNGDKVDKVTEKNVTSKSLDESELNVVEDYDPKKVYEISYFEKFSKMELISMIFSLQQYCHGRGKTGKKE